MLCHYPAMDIENGLLTCHNYLTFKEDDLAFFNSKEFTTKLFGIAGKLQKLSLTSDETNILRAFVIFNPGKDPDCIPELVCIELCRPFLCWEGPTKVKGENFAIDLSIKLLLYHCKFASHTRQPPINITSRYRQRPHFLFLLPGGGGFIYFG